MFSYEQRIKAVKLLIQYDMSYATVTRELGYPTSKSLRGWYQEYIKANSLHKTFVKQYKYTERDLPIKGTSPSVELVNKMLDNAISTLNHNEKPLIHSDRGCHYR